MRARSFEGCRPAVRLGKGVVLTGLWLGLIGAEARVMMVWLIG